MREIPIRDDPVGGGGRCVFARKAEGSALVRYLHFSQSWPAFWGCDRILFFFFFPMIFSVPAAKRRTRCGRDAWRCIEVASLPSPRDTTLAFHLQQFSCSIGLDYTYVPVRWSGKHTINAPQRFARNATPWEALEDE